MRQQTVLSKLFASILILLLILPTSVLANPSGGQVVSGSASFQQGGHTLNVVQGSDKAIVDWQSFSIDAGETTNFLQPSSTSAILNRVISEAPSKIFGNLNANGQVYLINQNGVVVGESGTIDTNGFVASTLDVSNADFMAGSDLVFSGTSQSGVINLGKISAVDGDVMLIARDVQNSGEISAGNGTVALAAGSEVLVKASGAERVFIMAGSADGTVENSGLIHSASAELKALGGNEFALAVNNEGAVRATGVEERNGRIWLVAEQGTVENSGRLTATQGERGGEVQVLGDRVALTGDARIDASGHLGGGNVLIGGDFQGKSSSIKNAAKTFVGANARIKADALQNGDGGKVIVWSDGSTQFSGSISATGGTVAGDGGFVEVSGKENLIFRGTVDASANNGINGQLLLDPKNITVADGGGNTVADGDAFADGGGANDITISPAAIEAIIGAGTDVQLQANNDITVADAIVSSGTGIMTFEAGRSITVDGTIHTNNSDINFYFNDSDADAGNRDAGVAAFINNALINAGTADVVISADNTLTGSAVNADTGIIMATNLSITHNEVDQGGIITLSGLTLTGALTVNASTGDVDIVNSTADGAIRVVGVTKLTTGGDVDIQGASTDLEVIGVTANNVTLYDKKAIEIGASGFVSTITNDLTLNIIGPVGNQGEVNVGGTTTLTTINGGFGISESNITLNNAANDFNIVTISQDNSGSSALIVDENALDLDGSFNGSLTVDVEGALQFEGSVGSDLTINAGGDITDSGAISVPRYLRMTAENDSDIVLDNIGNNLAYLDIHAANDATVVNGVDGLILGWYYWDTNPSIDITGNLALTANGTIQQQNYNTDNATNYNRLEVDGDATFTVTAANSNLYLGPSSSSVSGTQNNIGGTVTIAKSGVGSYTDFFLRNGNAAAGSIVGLDTVGTLDDVVIVYDNAANISLPGMTVGNTLYVKNGSGGITQSGGISVDSNTATFFVPADQDIILNHADNDFSRLKVELANNVELVDVDGIDLYTYDSDYDYFDVRGNLTVTAGGDIVDTGGYEIMVDGLAKFTAGANNIILDTYDNEWNQLQIVSANNVDISVDSNVQLLTSDIAGTFELDAHSAFRLSQAGGSAVTSGGNTTFRDFGNISLSETGNNFGPLYVYTGAGGTTDIQENAAITQWNNWYAPHQNVYLSVTDDQAISLGNTANQFGTINVTQFNNGNVTPGAVEIAENGSLAQAAAWTTHGETYIHSNSTINLSNAANVFAPLRVAGGTTYITENDTIEDYAAWATGITILNAYAGAVSGQGNIVLDETNNVMGDLQLTAQDVTITENHPITDYHGGGWNTPGTVILNAGNQAIDLDNEVNWHTLGGIDIDGTPSSVTIYENHDVTQSGAWVVGSAPVYINSTNDDIVLTQLGNVLGAISIASGNGTPNSVSITEDDTITQNGEWLLSGKAVNLIAENDKAIILTDVDNIMGDLTVTGGAVTITENNDITDGGAWTTTGVTTLNPGSTGATSIVLNNVGNVLGDIAVSGDPQDLTIVENDSITQASAWLLTDDVVTLTVSDDNDIVLDEALNIFGNLNLTAAGSGDVIVTENDIITDGSAWTVGGTATLNSGANNISLDADGLLGTLHIVATADALVEADIDVVQIDSAANVTIVDPDAIDFNTSNVSSLLSVSAGGHMTQTGGAINAADLLLIGSGYATLTDVTNDVNRLAAGFSGGDLQFTDTDDFSIATIGGTVGIGIGANDVTLRSVNNTLTGISDISNLSSSLTINTGTGLELPNMIIGGSQDYTAGGTGVTLTSSVQSTASGEIRFHSPVALNTDLTIQSLNSNITFDSTVNGNNNILTVNAGSGQISFGDAVSAFGDAGDAQVALSLTAGGSGTLFQGTLQANNGIAVTGPVTFRDDVTLGDGTVGSVFAGQVTLGKAGGMDLSGYDTLRFSGGVVLENGAATISSNNSLMTFEGANTINGPFDLALNAGTGEIIGLDHVGADLTSLDVTADEITIPGAGISIAGAQTYTATGGSDVTLNGNLTSTQAGAITFNSPVTMGASATVTSVDSNINFESTLDGPHDLTVNAGTGATSFKGQIGSISALGDGLGAALVLQNSGANNFDDAVITRSGITSSGSGAVSFANDVSLGDGDTGSTFAGAVTLGRAGEIAQISGYDGLTFSGEMNLIDGASEIISNGSTIAFGDAVSGTQNLTLNALANDAGTVTGLNHIAGDLTALSVTGQTLNLPDGLAVSGPMDFTAPGGITLNGAIGSAVAPATAAIDFNGAVTLSTGDITVTSNGGDITFADTIDGAQNLIVNTSGTTVFDGIIGGNTAVASMTTDAPGSVTVNGGAVTTTGAQTYNEALNLGADTVITGSDVTFAGSVDGGQALSVNDDGTTIFGGVVGGGTALTSLVTDAAGSTALNGGAITTVNGQTYNDAVTLGADTTLNSTVLTFNSTVDGDRALVANGSDRVAFSGSVGSNTALASLLTTGDELSLNTITTSGTQTYTAPVGITLDGVLTTSDSTVGVTGPVTLAGNSRITTGAGGGDIQLVGNTSTINGAFDLELAAGTGDVVLGGVVGLLNPLTGIDVSGNNLTLPMVVTDPAGAQNYAALNDLTLNQSRTISGPMSFTADADNSGAGSFILLDGVSLNATNNTIDITAADLDLQGNSSLNSGSGLITITASAGSHLGLGDTAGDMTISGAELEKISSSGGLTLNTSGTGQIFVDNITAANSNNISGLLTLAAAGDGDINFINNVSTFNALTSHAGTGNINLAQNLNTTNDAIIFATPVVITGASEVNSDGGDIDFQSTIAVSNPLTLTSDGGALSFADNLNSNSTLLMNLGGGSVSGLNHLQSTLTGLTINSDTAITLPAIAINGAQEYNTGVIEVTGNLSGIGLAFNNIVNVSGNGLELNSGSGLLTFANMVNFNANDIILSGDEIDFNNSVNGSGALTLRPSTDSVNVLVGGSDNTTGALDLTAADLTWLSATLSGLTIGRTAGSGSLIIAAATDLSQAPLVLNGTGGISQTGALTADALTLFSNGVIDLTNSDNALGAIALSGAPTSVAITDTTAITQSGAWLLGAADVTLDAGSEDITLTAATNTFGTLTLTGGTVTIVENAATDLGASGTIDNLAVSSTGAITTSGAVTVTNAAGFKTLNDVAQDITLADNSTFGTVSAATRNTADDASVNGTVRIAPGNSAQLDAIATTGDVILTAANGESLSQTGTATLAAAGLELLGGGSHDLTAGTNAIATLAGNTQAVNLQETDGFAIGSVNSVGLTTSGNAQLVSGGAISQTEKVVTDGLLVGSGGAVTLTHADNDVNVLAAYLTDSNLTFRDTDGFSIGAVNGTSGISTGSGDVSLRTTGSVTQAEALTAAGVELLAGTYTLDHIDNAITTLAGNATSVQVRDDSGFAIGTVNSSGLTTGGSIILESAGDVSQTQALVAGSSLSLDGGGDFTLTNATNNVVNLMATAGNINYRDADSLILGTLGSGVTTTGNVILQAAGAVTQADVLTIGGNLAITTTHNAGDVTINNSGAAGTIIGNSLVGGNYALTASGDPVTQAAGSGLKVAGTTHVDSASVSFGGSGNIFGDTVTTPARAELVSSGEIVLGNVDEVGDYSVTSIASADSFGGATIAGSAVTLNDPTNNIVGSISVITDAPVVVDAGDVKTGIRQAPGTTISIVGTASFTAEDSTVPGSGVIDLTNSGNSFGTLVLTGSDVTVLEDTGDTKLGGVDASGLLTVTSSGHVTQTGPIKTPALTVNAANGLVNLSDVDNDVDTLTITADGAVAFTDVDGVTVAGVNVTDDDVILNVGGDLTQSGALSGVNRLTVASEGAIDLDESGVSNQITVLGPVSAATGIAIADNDGNLSIDGDVAALAGDIEIRADDGNLTLADTRTITAAGAGNIILAAGLDHNFTNADSTPESAALVLDGGRFIIYSDNNSDTTEGGLSGSAYMGRTYAANDPAWAAANDAGGNRFYYNDTATLTFTAVDKVRSYGDGNPALTYVVTGLLAGDSEADAFSGNPTLNTAAGATSNAGDYAITIDGTGLTNDKGYVFAFVDGTLTVDPKSITVTAADKNKVYGGTDPGLTYSVDVALVAGDSFDGALSRAAGEDVGDYIIGQNTLLVNDGNGGSNYDITFVDGTFSITPAALTVTAANDSKTYDGLAYSGGNGVSYSGFVGGEDSTVLGGALSYGGSSQGAVNAGLYQVMPQGLSSGNYTISYVAGELTVDKANLVISTSDVTKNYDGRFTATGNAVVSVGSGTQLFGTDSLSGGNFAFIDANAGSGKVVTTADVSVNDGNGGNNYVVSYVNNTTSTINKANLTVSSADVTKSYDGTLTAAGSAIVVGGNLYANASNGDVVDSLSGGSFAFADANAGTGKTVMASGVNINDGNGGGNYNVTYTDNTTSTINKANLVVSSTSVTKTYDGTLAAAGSANVVGGTLYSNASNGGVIDSLSGGDFAFSDANAGSGKTVTTGNVTVVDGNGGDNYNVTYTDNTTSIINKANLVVSSTSVTKTYDGTLAAAGSANVVSGTLYANASNGGAMDSISGGDFAFADANAGTNKTVTASGVTVNDGNGGNNYTISYVANSTSTIDKANLTISSGNVTKIYDGTLAADGTATVVGGTLYANASNGGAVDSLSGGSFAFTDANAGSGKTVTVNGVTVNDGNGGGNYHLNYADNTTSTIEKAGLVISSTDVTKIYDGTLSADGDAVVVAGTLYANASNGGRVDSVDGGSFSFTDANAGSGKAVVVSDVTVNDGNGGNNYAVTYVANVNGFIGKANLVVAAVDDSKTYDAAAYSGGNGVTYSGFVNDENSTVLSGLLSYTGSSQGAVNAGSYAISPQGLVSGNYELSFVDGTLTVDKAVLTYVATSTERPYNTANPVYSGTVTGFLGGDSLTDLDGAAVWTTNATATSGVGSYAINGGGLRSGNYAFVQAPGNARALTIVPKLIEINGQPMELMAEGQDWQLVGYNGDLLVLNRQDPARLSADEMTQNFLADQMAPNPLPLLAQLPEFQIEFDQQDDFGFGNVYSVQTSFDTDMANIGSAFGAYYSDPQRSKKARDFKYLD